MDTLPATLDPKDPERSAAAGSASPIVIVPAAGNTVSGPITDIPEFHDCQRFIAKKGNSYEALYAIFSAHNLDSIVKTLVLDSVFTWTSSNPKVASVTPEGSVTAVTAGTVAITAAATADSNRKANVTIIVMAGQAKQGQDTVSIGPAAASPPAMHPGEHLVLMPTVGPATTTTLAVGEIWTSGTGYPRLGIGPNYSCLYLYVDDTHRLVGRVVPAPLVSAGSGVFKADACVGAVDPAHAAGGVDLAVIRRAGGSIDDYPPVARWDYDAAHHQYYVGIKCGAGWCEVGANGFIPSVALGTPQTSAGESRVTRIKGWYDQQELSWLQPGDAEVTPSGIVATVIPNPGLADPAWNKQFYEDPNQQPSTKPWKVTGYVAFDVSNAKRGAEQYYLRKFGFTPAPGDRPLAKLNTISMCYGTTSTCKVPSKTPPCINDVAPGLNAKHAWAKFGPAAGGAPMYKCITRRDHGLAMAPYIAATARWRWIVKDETIWEYCAAVGCCETYSDLY